MVFDVKKEIESIERKADRLEKKISTLSNEYKPIPRSSFEHTAHGILTRINLLTYKARDPSYNNGKEELVDRAKDELSILGKYISAIKKDEQFREYEFAERLGILSRLDSNVTEEEIRKLQMKPEEYINKALEYIGR